MMRFPTVVAKNLEGQDVRVPDDLPSGPRVVMIAFERWHQNLIDTWGPALDELEARCRELSVWEVPALSRLYLPVRGFIDGGMRAGITDAEIRRHTLTAYTDLSALAKELHLPTTDTIYVMLLDPDGAIQWTGEGESDSRQIAALKQALEKMACTTVS